MSKEGKVILDFAGQAIVNGVKNSIANEPLPSVKDIICDGKEGFEKIFDRLQKNGERTWQKVAERAAVRLKIMQSQKSI